MRLRNIVRNRAQYSRCRSRFLRARVSLPGMWVRATNSPRNRVPKAYASSRSFLICASAISPRLEWMGQHHLLYFLDLFQQIVNQSPVPTRFQDRFAWPFQTGKESRKPLLTVAFHSPFPHLLPHFVHRTKHAILLVYIHSHIVHENSSFL